MVLAVLSRAALTEFEFKSPGHNIGRSGAAVGRAERNRCKDMIVVCTACGGR